MLRSAMGTHFRKQITPRFQKISPEERTPWKKFKRHILLQTSETHLSGIWFFSFLFLWNKISRQIRGLQVAQAMNSPGISHTLFIACKRWINKQFASKSEPSAECIRSNVQRVRRCLDKYLEGLVVGIWHLRWSQPWLHAVQNSHLSHSTLHYPRQPERISRTFQLGILSSNYDSQRQNMKWPNYSIIPGGG